jgi:hypothetical protein
MVTGLQVIGTDLVLWITSDSSCKVLIGLCRLSIGLTWGTDRDPRGPNASYIYSTRPVGDHGNAPMREE